VAATDAIGFEKKLDEIVEMAAVEGDGNALFKTDGDLFALDFDIVAPEGRAMIGTTILMDDERCSRSFASWVAPRMLESVE
jgi:hypothetical protein